GDRPSGERVGARNGAGQGLVEHFFTGCADVAYVRGAILWVPRCFVHGRTKSSYVSLASCAILSSMTSSLARLRLPKPRAGRAILRHRAKSSLGTDEFPQIVTGSR